VMSPGGDVVVVDGEGEVVDFPFIQSLVVGIGEFVLPNEQLETGPNKPVSIAVWSSSS
jgi:hypothetical protein